MYLGLEQQCTSYLCHARYIYGMYGFSSGSELLIYRVAYLLQLHLEEKNSYRWAFTCGRFAARLLGRYRVQTHPSFLTLLFTICMLYLAMYLFIFNFVHLARVEPITIVI